ncbi:hypothetical protein ACH4LK_16805 [Streptomyces lydicus]|uniref:hypothetical protein n=1 Tax=Streptomyces lydicus TaxID=47763 RepID=UPI00379D68E8
MTGSPSTCGAVFLACHEAATSGVLIRRSDKNDKEFHFQNWVADRIEESGFNVHPPKRNSYPDFALVDRPEGYEVKGLKNPGRHVDFDCNSQIANGIHQDRSIYYVFGRYPARTNSNEYAVEDLVICHGDFLNADRTYEHLNKSFAGFGSFGDIRVRDRKMYIAPTPYSLAEGTEGEFTLIAPLGAGCEENPELTLVGELERVESGKVVTEYSFDLRANTLITKESDNPTAGGEHRFLAFRAKGASDREVRMKKPKQIPAQMTWSEVDDYQES